MATVDGFEFPEGLWYDPAEHLWLAPGAPDAGGSRAVTVGLDALGVEALGEVVYIQLVDPGGRVRQGEALGSLEAEKMVRPVVAPVSGLVTEVNALLLAAPRLLNTDPYGRGWLARIAAERWDAEAGRLLTAGPVEAWARAELAAHRERQ
jgi:glycine cleavage system H protein